jgi:16S rRNA (guanine527-N7)-methyltransferase
MPDQTCKVASVLFRGGAKVQVPRGTSAPRRPASGPAPARLPSRSPLRLNALPRRLDLAWPLTRRLQSVVLTESRVHNLLEPFGLELKPEEIGQLLTYLELLLRWNQKINLTAIRKPEECVTRHFGESLYLSRWIELRGKLLDIGSGAGFPGLALKITFPALAVTLLEPTAKKRAFLKEVARACGMQFVEARGERLEEFSRALPAPCYDAASARAVGDLSSLVPQALRCLIPGGRLAFWLSREQAKNLERSRPWVDWRPPVPLPLARQRVILVGHAG